MSDKLGKMVTNVIEVEKNGVKVVIKQQYNKEINDINIDFSEHDKVFEDKIAELKKDYKTASELLGKYQQENERLKKRIIELENFSCQAEQETESLVEKLKQRIAELESENEKLFDCLGGITGNTRDEIKNNIENSKKISKKTIKTHTFIVGKEIDGQTYVTLDDFMSVVNDLQAEIGN